MVIKKAKNSQFFGEITIKACTAIYIQDLPKVNKKPKSLDFKSSKSLGEGQNFFLEETQIGRHFLLDELTYCILSLALLNPV